MAVGWWRRIAAQVGLPSASAAEVRQRRAQRYRAIVDAIGQPALVVDRDGIVQLANAAALLAFDHERSRLEGGPVAALLPGWDQLARQQPDPFLSNPASTAHADQPNAQARLGSGRTVPVMAAVNPLADGSGLFLVTLRDLSQAVAARDETSAHLDTIMRTAPIGLIFCTPDLQVADLNELAAEMLAADGWPAGQRSGRLSGTLGTAIAAQVERVLHAGQPITELEVEPPAGADRRHYLLSAYPVRRGDRIVQVGVVLVDNTADQRAKETLEYRLEFEQLLASLSTQFINLPFERIDEGIGETVRSVAEFIDVDEALLVRLADDEGEIAYQWRANGQPGLERVLPLSALRWSVAHLRALEPVVLARLADLEDEAERGYHAARGIGSLLAVPLVARGGAIGFLSVSTVERETVWTSLDIAFLRLAGVLIVTALERKRTAAVERESERLAGIDLAAREIAHLLNNDLTGAIGVLELLIASPQQLDRLEPLMRGALSNLRRAADHLQQLQSVSRVATKETAVGPALDLSRSVGS
jgi:PAS domain-containing protein